MRSLQVPRGRMHHRRGEVTRTTVGHATRSGSTPPREKTRILFLWQSPGATVRRPVAPTNGVAATRTRSPRARTQPAPGGGRPVHRAALRAPQADAPTAAASQEQRRRRTQPRPWQSKPRDRTVEHLGHLTCNAVAKWLTAESLGHDDRALRANPDLPVVFVFGEPLLGRLQLSVSDCRHRCWPPGVPLSRSLRSLDGDGSAAASRSSRSTRSLG